jgi:lysozyme
MPVRKVSQVGRSFIKAREGYRAEAYQCGAGVWTIGWGHTSGVVNRDSVTKEQAEVMLTRDLAVAEEIIHRRVNVGLNSAQHAALISWAMNCPTDIKVNTLYNKLNAGDYDAVPEQLARWNKITNPHTGKKEASKGLTNRRALEVAMWVSHPDSKLPHARAAPDNPERQSKLQSTTLGLAGTGLLASGFTVAQSAMAADWRTMAIVAFLLVLFAVMARERIKKWGQGDT